MRSGALTAVRAAPGVIDLMPPGMNGIDVPGVARRDRDAHRKDRRWVWVSAPTTTLA